MLSWKFLENMITVVLIIVDISIYIFLGLFKRFDQHVITIVQLFLCNCENATHAWLSVPTEPFH